MAAPYWAATDWRRSSSISFLSYGSGFGEYKVSHEEAGNTIGAGLVGDSARDEWPMWRGPKLDGHSEEKNLPVRWSGSENVAWKISVRGRGIHRRLCGGSDFFDDGD